MAVFITSKHRCRRTKNPSYDWGKDWEPERDHLAEFYEFFGFCRIGDKHEERRMLRDWWELCFTLPSPEVLDFLLGCVHAAVQVKESEPQYPHWFVLPGTFELDPSLVHQVTDSFPRLDRTSSILDLIGPEILRNERYLLLKWLTDTFGHRIVQATGDLHVPEVPSLIQFVQLSSEPRHQEGFRMWIKTRCPEGGRAAFHGTRTTNLLNILHGGLWAPGERVFFASDPEIAMQFIYCRGIGYGRKSMGAIKGWKNSAFRDVVVLLGVEVARKEIGWFPFDRYLSGKCFPGEIVVRHIFVISQDTLKNSVKRNRGSDGDVSIDDGSQARAAMEEVYRRIHRGDFNKEELQKNDDLE
ncbi:hypothetical protein GGR51DRAFT_571195 [Nemania sp. FL0031]|nr:hypothetical protein GGR51DRAFT_571195 [Nemania sp. FL0031]